MIKTRQVLPTQLAAAVAVEGRTPAWSEASTKKLRKEVRNVVENEKREKNVILHRIIEKGDIDEAKVQDKEIINKLLTVCGVTTDAVADFKRLGAKTDGKNPRPLLVTFKQLEYKIALFKNVRNLRNAEVEVKVISVNHDMSIEERAGHKKLVEESKQKEIEDPAHRYRVRGTPRNWRIAQMSLA